ncbi:YybS family protein [Desulfococcaceae bacterium HSG9]|nr:YybS family protein [Desulfococcaceae bacterium HSG9]
MQSAIHKDIVNGIAITCCILAVSVFIPLLGFPCALFIPLPILFYRQKLGRQQGGLMLLLIFTAMGVILGGISFDLLFFGGLVLVGFTLSELFEMNLSIEKTIGLACGVTVGIGFALLIIYINFSSSDFTSLISEYVDLNLKLTMALYKNMGMSDANVQALANSLDMIKYVLIRIIPALVVAATLFVAWINVLLAKPLLKRKKMPFPDFGTLNTWQAPEYLIWAAIGCALLLFFPDKGFKMIGANGILVLMTIYFFQGIAITAYFFEKKNLPRAFRFFFYTLITIQQFILLLVIGIGFFDMWLNLRKLKKLNTGNQSPDS